MQPRETQKLSWVAPKQPGVYPIVCTYPGHWMVMWAKLIVTKDVDAYLAKHPQPEELPPTFTQPAPEPK